MRISKNLIIKLFLFIFVSVVVFSRVLVVYAAEPEEERISTITHEIEGVSPERNLSGGFFTVFPGDTVQYFISVRAEDDLCGLLIVNDFGLTISTLDSIQVYNANGTQIPFASYAVQVSEDKREMELDLSLLPEEAESVSVLYSNTVDRQVAVGEQGMYSKAFLVLTDGSELLSQMIPRVYSFDLQLHVVDTSLPQEKDEAEKNGMRAYVGQGLSGVGIELFYDESCEIPVTFQQEFRTYTYNGDTESVHLLTTDSSGRMQLRGLGAGTYYLKVYPVSTVQETALETIPVTVGFENEDGYASVPAGVVSVNMISDDTVVTTTKAGVKQIAPWQEIIVDMGEEPAVSGVTATIYLVIGCIAFLSLVTAVLVLIVVAKKRTTKALEDNLNQEQKNLGFLDGRK